MSDTRKIDPAYYENHCFGDDLAEAELGGCLVVAEPGENTLDAIKRYAQSRRETVVLATGH
jgi:hypothetical protein